MKKILNTDYNEVDDAFSKDFRDCRKVVRYEARVPAAKEAYF